jgi:hypothetical protein
MDVGSQFPGSMENVAAGGGAKEGGAIGNLALFAVYH